MLRKILDVSRFLMVLPVIGSLLLTISVVIMGLGMILAQEWQLLQQGEVNAKSAKQLTITVIQTIDMFLVGAISYIIAVGIYKLFITYHAFVRRRATGMTQAGRGATRYHSSGTRSASRARALNVYFALTPE